MDNLEQTRSQISEKYKRKLQEELTDDALGQFQSGECDRDGQIAAYELAAALGMCRILNIDPLSLDGTLTESMADAASEALLSWLPEWTAFAKRLPEKWFECEDDLQADNLCSVLLDRRMECDAVQETVLEAYLSAVQDESPQAESLGEQLKQVQDGIEEFDDALESQRDILSSLAYTYYLSNHRSEFEICTPEQPIPWWLDAQFEAAGRTLDYATLEQNQHSLQGLVPTTADWKKYPPRVLAADSPKFSSNAIYEWVPTDEEALRAVMLVPIPPPDGDETQIWIVFEQDDGQPAIQLKGDSILCGGCESTIDDNGRAAFTYGQLRAAAQELNLIVNGHQWKYVENH